MKKQKGVLYLKLLLFVLIVSTGVFFQQPKEGAAQSLVHLSINTNPQYPKANEELSVRVRSFSTDLNKAEIIWYLNGIMVHQGIGEDRFSFTTGGAGEFAVIDIVVHTHEGITVQRNLSVNPAEVDLIWEAENSSVPPFYRGKPLFPREGKLKIVAIPNFYDLNGEKISADNLVYSWKLNNQNISEQSGVGKNILSIDGPRLDRPINVTVEVSSLDDSIKAKNSIVVRSSSQRSIFYQNHPLYGILFNRSPEEFSLIESAISLAPFPFFFEKSPGESNLNYSWKLNNQTATNLEGRREASFQQEDSQLAGGVSTVSVTIVNMKNGRQSAEDKTTIRLSN